MATYLNIARRRRSERKRNRTLVAKKKTGKNK
jgi:hypothetical protein